MRASRLLSMLMLLQLRGRVSAAALARQFEVSVRTIYRDVDALSAAGIPIYADPGRNGGISLHEGYRTRLTGLTLAEAAALPVASLSAAAKDLGVSAEATAAHLKLLTSLPAEAGATAQGIAERFHSDPVPWYHRAEGLACLPALADAVWRGRRIAVRYQSWKGGVRRRLDPLGLVQKGGIWYLVAARQGKALTYRVSNIQSLEALEQAATRPPGFELARYWEEWSAAFEARLMGSRARVRISEEGREILRAVAPAAAQVVAETQRPCDPPGWVEAEFPFETPAYSARQVLRLGVEMEVLEPAALREAVAAEARAVAGVYGQGGD